MGYEGSVMRGMNQIPSSEITPLSVYLNRRAFMKAGDRGGQSGDDRMGLPPAQSCGFGGGRHALR